MTRVKRGIVTKRRHKKVLKAAKGFWGQRKNIFKRAKETLLRAMAFSFHGRKLKKRDYRGLFITRIKAAAEANSTKYNLLIHGLKKANVGLNRKMLSQIAIYDPSVFTKIVQAASSK
ncbi:50S ribosomal protein L20 [Candidatus Dependentiae bacterium]|nr:50S ribosomal protein L20 [Candidatus Dependentiae bacterium]